MRAILGGDGKTGVGDGTNRRTGLVGIRTYPNPNFCGWLETRTDLINLLFVLGMAWRSILPTC